MEAIDAVIGRWRADGVALNPPASAQELARLEAELGTPLPSDVRHYFSAVDGMEDCEMEGAFCVGFWSIEKMLSDPWRHSGSDARGEFRDLAFADVMICSSFICFRTRPGSGLSIHVEEARLELPSLEVFFRRWLEEPDDLSLWKSQSP